MKNAKQLLLLLAVSLLAGFFCRYENIDPRVRIEYYKYRNLIIKNCPKDFNRPLYIDVSVGLTDDSKTIGMCYDTGSSPKIVLSESYLREHGHDKRTSALVAHELTHCLLHQDHIKQEGHYMNPNDQDIPSIEWLDYHIVEHLKTSCK